ncbi:MAG TPA: NAD(+) synthase [Nocardioides sp.]|nr:NAD(+) synthase [Nocardioides sp.]
MDFYSAYAQGFARVAAVTLPVAVADPATNAARTLEQARLLHDEGVAVAVFPELGLTGYAVDDLFLQDTLLDAVEEALIELTVASAELRPVLVVGAPLRSGHRVYNCGIVIHRGEVLGVAPKSYLPTYREFYEARWFASGAPICGQDSVIELNGVDVPFGNDLIFTATDVPGLRLHVEVCEDMWVPVPPSANAALAGATVLANLSGSPITIARAADRHLLAKSASMRCNAAYVYAAAGQGESTTDLSWDGQTMIYEFGELLAEGDRFPGEARRTIADVDLDRIRQERMRQGTFDDNRHGEGVQMSPYPSIEFTLEPPTGDVGLRRKVAPFPFVPDDPARLAQDCYEAYNIQVSGLEQRLAAIGQPKVVIGVSGGLDSTHALIVAAKAMDRLGRPRSDIHAFTMPGFATGETTKSYATTLATALGCTFAELDIRPAAEQMLTDLGHAYPGAETEVDPSVYDVTFENVQAGLRTDYLFRLANHRGGIVLGTGDLSELALGWCTYGVGDQMSHYNVNAGVPKTLIQHLIRWVISTNQLDDVDEVLQAILEQEITPELIPGGEQKTEDSVGPYALQDFNLYYTLRRGYRPSKIAFLQHHAWGDTYDLATTRRWLEVFVRRFFSSQFKRSALPNGPKVSPGGTMSPRGDWRMPSDASAAAWLAELENVPSD